MKEIDRLKEQGLLVKVSHLRNAKPKVVEDETITLNVQLSVRALRARGYEPDSFGGTTVVRLTMPNGVEFKEVIDVTPLDHYTKKIGILIGLGRLTKGQAFNDALTSAAAVIATPATTLITPPAPPAPMPVIPAVPATEVLPAPVVPPAEPPVV